MPRVEIDKQSFDAMCESLRDLPSMKPVSIQVNAFRALLRLIDRDSLPDGDELPPPPAKEAAKGPEPQEDSSDRAPTDQRI